MATKSNKKLPDKYWNHSEWKKTFQLQIIKANSLLKLYDNSCIMRALNSWYGRNCYSLNSPYLEQLIQQEQDRFDRLKDKSEQRESTNTPDKVVERKSQKKDKLAGL